MRFPIGDNRYTNFTKLKHKHELATEVSRSGTFATWDFLRVQLRLIGNFKTGCYRRDLPSDATKRHQVIVTETNNEELPTTETVNDGQYMFDSAEQSGSPRLTHRGLTVLLAIMCAIPVTTILVLWQYLPPVHEGQLEANVVPEGLPPLDFYKVEYQERPKFEGGFIVLQNKSDQDWTHLNVQVNGHYQVYDTEPIKAHGEKRYELSRFLNRTGARFSLQYNELNRVRIYARRPTKDRATYVQKFDTFGNYDPSFAPVVILLGAFFVLMVLASLMFRKMWTASERENALTP